MKGTVVSFGDFEQCLEINQDKFKPNFVGSHSLIQLEYVKREDVKSNISLLMSETFPVLGVVNLHFSLCLPSTCSGGEVKSLVNKGNSYSAIMIVTQLLANHIINVFNSFERLSIQGAKYCGISDYK